MTRFFKILLFLLICQSVWLGVAYTKECLREGKRFGGDFILFWQRAEAVAVGELGRVYDMQIAKQIPDTPRPLAKDELFLIFPYPPYFLLALWPLGFLPMGWAVVVWMGGTLALYGWALFTSDEWRAAKTLGPGTRRLIGLFAALSPFVIGNLLSGQTGFLLAALLMCGLQWRGHRPVAAGIAFGLLAFKPQLAMLVPVMLIAAREWKIFFTAALTFGALIAASLIAWGPQLWLDYPPYISMFTHALDYITGLAVDLNASLYRGLRDAGVASAVALPLQLLSTATAVWAVWKAFARPHDRALQNAILICATFIAAPHVMTYDMPMFILPVLMLLARVFQNQSSMEERLVLIAMLTVTPLVAMQANALGIPIVFLVSAGALLLFVTHLKRR